MVDSNELTVVIADDEELICDLIKSLIHWDRLNMRLLAVVSDGQELYEVIKAKRPDIVITDISMPNIDGLNLIQRVRNEEIPCKFIIVSGYRQFEYAHNALKYDVADYLLKPVEESELNKALRKLANRDIAEKEAEIGSERMKSIFLSRIIFEIQNRDETPESIYRDYGILFQDGFFMVIQMKLDITDEAPEAYEYNNSLNYKLKNLFMDIFADLCHQILFDESSLMVCAGINYARQNDKAVKEAIKLFMQLAQNVLDLFIGICFTIGVGEPYNEVTRFAQSYYDACESIENRVVEGTDRIIFHSGLANAPSLFSENQKKSIILDIVRSVESVNINDFEMYADKIFDFPDQHFPAVAIQAILREIISGLDIQDAYNKQLIFGLKNATSVKKLKSAFTKPLLNFLKAKQEEIERKNTKPVRLALQYIEEHYGEQIRLEDLADRVNLNPVYFSQVFKKQTGENFSDYLIGYRMDMAKQLLINSGYNINEISDKVGYSDSSYFSRLFKKTVGIKPSEYRKLYG